MESSSANAKFRLITSSRLPRRRDIDIVLARVRTYSLGPVIRRAGETKAGRQGATSRQEV